MALKTVFDLPLPSEKLWKTVQEEGTSVSFQPGEYLYHQNVSSPGVFFIESGRVKLSWIKDNGTESFLRIVPERSVFGETSAFSGEDSSPAAIALTPVQAYLISPKRTRELILENGDFALFLVESLVYRLKGQSDQVGNISGKKVASRLAAILCTLDYYGIPCDETGCYSITHADLAALAGAVRPNITSVLNRFEKAGWVRLKRNKIWITDFEQLKAAAEAEE